MQNNLIHPGLIEETLTQCGISSLDNASIRDIVKAVNLLEQATGEKFIRMEMGVPGLPPSRTGTEAEIHALEQGVLSHAGRLSLTCPGSLTIHQKFHGYSYPTPGNYSDRRRYAGFIYSLYGFD